MTKQKFGATWVLVVVVGIALMVYRTSRRETAEIAANAGKNGQKAPIESQVKTASQLGASPLAVESAVATPSQQLAPLFSYPSMDATKKDNASLEVSRRKAFRQKADDVFQHLPTPATFAHATAEEVHEEPAAIQAAGRQMGEIAESLSKDSTLAADGLRFYEHCFKRPDVVPQVRALCLADYRHLKKSRAGASDPVGLQNSNGEDLSGVPRQVIDLANQIPD